MSNNLTVVASQFTARKIEMKTPWSVLLYLATSAALIVGPAVSAGESAGHGAAAPKYSPDVPAKITTPDVVETRIGKCVSRMVRPMRPP